MPNFIDMTGQTFGRWNVLARAGGRKWLCRCSCGAEKPVDGSTLRNGTSISCGCHRDECTKARVTTHGKARPGSVASEWNIWSGMKQRCLNKASRSYLRYGGRGIAVCARWLKSFENFFADMGHRPSTNHTLERIDNDGPYSPENCRWATRHEQCRNTRKNRLVTFHGVTASVAEWASRTGLNDSTICFRLDNGWSVEDTLAKSLIRGRPGPRIKGEPFVVRKNGTRLRAAQRTCSACGAEFLVSLSALKNPNKGHFCSRSCARKKR
jgi:hypothetical protein